MEWQTPMDTKAKMKTRSFFIFSKKQFIIFSTVDAAKFGNKDTNNIIVI